MAKLNINADRGPVSLTSLSQEDWTEIRGIARDMFKSEQYGTDQGRVYIHAFVAWIATMDADFTYDDDDLLQMTIH